ncbi:MAG TPA: tetratricopeptide repeat protein [Verrucomicrobiae bacterium]|nr:tetratricopeptide repeat protein [Verrucomicrobiae bacterium]
MNDLLAGLVGAMLATNQPLAVSNLIQQQTGLSIAVTTTNDPAEQELERIMRDDDAAHDEIDRWIRDNQAFKAQGAGEPDEELNRRIIARLGIVRTNYLDFLKRYTNNARGYLAYGSFLNDMGDEQGAAEEYKKSMAIDPKNPAVWNNLANYYGEWSPVTNAFAYYTQAIRLNPAEPVYYENFATTVYLYRKDAREFYHLNEQQVFDKAMGLYAQAMKLDPTNFKLATDVAQSYYGIKPYRTNDALVAWTNALNLARDEVEREGVRIHLARMKMLFGKFDDARAELAAVTNSAYDDLKDRVAKAIVQREKEWTNPPPADLDADLTPTNLPPKK